MPKALHARPLRVAVIGSGIAGLTAAWRCRQAGFAVTVYEAAGQLGMDAHGCELDGHRVDMPLRVMGEAGWPRMLALAEELGVGSYPVRVDVSSSDASGHCWFRSGRLPVLGWPTAGGLRHLGLRSARLALGLLRLRQSLPDDAGQSLADWLVETRLDPLFVDGLLLPALATICTCSRAELMPWPARQLLQAWLAIVDAPRLRRLRGGTRALVQAMSLGLDAVIGSPVEQLAQEGDAITVRNRRGDRGRYDYAIVATQANQLDYLEGSALRAQARVLAAVPYASGELLLHRDAALMPRQRRDWVALNFRVRPGNDGSEPMFTVFVNSVDPPLDGAQPLFQSWSPEIEPEAGTLIARVRLQRAIVGPDNAAILAKLADWHRQPGRRVFYCGSWAAEGIPLLETAVRSAEDVVAMLRLRAGG